MTEEIQFAYDVPCVGVDGKQHTIRLPLEFAVALTKLRPIDRAVQIDSDNNNASLCQIAKVSICITAASLCLSGKKMQKQPKL